MEERFHGFNSASRAGPLPIGSFGNPYRVTLFSALSQRPGLTTLAKRQRSGPYTPRPFPMTPRAESPAHADGSCRLCHSTFNPADFLRLARNHFVDSMTCIPQVLNKNGDCDASSVKTVYHAAKSLRHNPQIPRPRCSTSSAFGNKSWLPITLTFLGYSAMRYRFRLRYQMDRRKPPECHEYSLFRFR